MHRRYEPRPNYGRLWRNHRKQASRQSDFLGTIDLQDGNTYHIGVTRRSTFAGEEFLTIYLRPALPLRQKMS
jgi:hypothetical protein